ncbi:MAG: DUF4215 domain-containing protein [Myxococcales bacterium]|nr:DUF4215 domain-containing protein [Myxococcales bacterium]MCB9530165.1 DUF4215 domain-containing protein [Myxococcales bacterium]MCB9534169.1 DUF4215 domain-containing protein [Myxococcales bacterium]
MLANAVSMTRRTGVIDVVVWTQYGDLTTEVPNTIAALQAGAAVIGINVNILTYATTDAMLAALTTTADVLVIPEQETIANTSAVVAAVQRSLARFVASGGVVILCEDGNEGRPLLDAPQLLAGNAAGVVLASATVTVNATPELTRGLPSSFTAVQGTTTTTLTGSADAVIATTITGVPSSLYRRTTCGDGVVDSPYDACDAGAANSNSPGAACRPGCFFAGCGDGIVDPGEACDDGNLSNVDTCTNACAAARCGDGFIQAGEVCDDGNLDETDTCLGTCQPGPTFEACADLTLGSAVGNAVISGSVVGLTNDYVATCGGTGRGVDRGFLWVAPTTGIYQFDTNGSDYDTVLHVHIADGTCTGAELVCDDDAGDGTASLLTYSVAAGVSYFIVLDAYTAVLAAGNYVLNINPVP